MTLYQYGNDSVIQKISMSKSAGGGMRTFLFASDAATREQTAAIKDLVSRQGWHCVATEKDGANCLELRGIRDIERLETALRMGNMVAPGKRSEQKDGAKISAADRIRGNMLLVSGGLNAIADVGFLAYGHLKSKLPGQTAKTHWEETAAGAAYMTGSGMLTLFGHGDKSDHHIHTLCAKLHEKLLLDGLEVPERSAIRSFIGTPQDALGKARRFMEKYPSEMGNASYALAGAFIAKGARNSNDPKTKLVDTALGLTTLASGLTPVIVKEEAPDLTRPPPKGILGKFTRWVEERPNRVAGYGYMVSSIAHAEETIRNLVNAKKNYPGDAKRAILAYSMRGVFTGFNLLSETVLTLSSKGHGSGVKSDKSIDETAYAITADAIFHQPEALREKLIVDLSHHFLTRADVLGGKAEAIEAQLRARIEKLEHNPWAPVHAAPAKGTDAQSQQATTHAPPLSRWTEREMANAAKKESAPAAAMG